MDELQDQRAASAPCRDRGGIAVFVAICAASLLGIIGIALDGGMKIRATERADALATEAARAGGQAIDPEKAVSDGVIVADPQAARSAAQSYLKSAGTSGSITVSRDGTKLTVTIHSVYTTRFLSIVGISSMPVTGHGQATLTHGVIAPEEGP
ncbi:TadE/TadG family type IV pilus assembly protein [Streptomyces sp. NBC_01766]|uniref:TadE/TadG family type IV pilus assembly protein n=1 Tax=Streptomyces sp. NBC_01766 TaxID=2975936 RepID=UPI002DD99E75|nr:pilus assembly protein TadG-related protein [Streptomyces sp. NBC_01766]WSC24930.1 pilus assembly protein TadG-related protein [Streptomyces sp. NBC_01766]